MKIFAKDNRRVDGQWNTGTGDKTFISILHINAVKTLDVIMLRWYGKPAQSSVNKRRYFIDWLLT